MAEPKWQTYILSLWMPTRPDGMCRPDACPISWLMDVISLQLSTSISMPFHPHRPYRMMDHFHQSRFPVAMQHPPSRAPPVRAMSYDGWKAPAAIRPPYPPTYSHPPGSHVLYGQYRGTPASNPAYTPHSTDLGGSYLSAAPTPDIQEANDYWDGGETCRFSVPDASLTPDVALNFDRTMAKTGPYEDFGLGLGPLGTDLNPVTVNTSDADGLSYPVGPLDPESAPLEPDSPEGRSWSSISDSGSGLLSEFPDLSADVETGSLHQATMSNFDCVSSRNGSSELPPHRFAKPALPESSPHARYRAAPYPMQNGRGRRLSTGSVALSRSQRGSPYHHVSQSTGFELHQSSHTMTQNTMAFVNGLDFDIFGQPPPQPNGFAGGQFDHASILLPSPAEEPDYTSTCSSALTSPDIVNILHSSDTAQPRCEHHFTGSSKPPDLFGPLLEDQIPPPPEDMDCEESERPRAQELRFEGDLYTPKYVRGHGNKREGWCGICKPGRWLVLKNSAFWYDKSFTHGISAATGSAFESPRETRKMKGNPDVWEGLCHGCGEWIALISSKKKGTTWFRHAYKVCDRPQRHVVVFVLIRTPVPHAPKGQGHSEKATRSFACQRRARFENRFRRSRQARSLAPSRGVGSHIVQRRGQTIGGELLRPRLRLGARLNGCSRLIGSTDVSRLLVVGPSLHGRHGTILLFSRFGPLRGVLSMVYHDA